MSPRNRRVRVQALAKINLTLRVLGTRPDGYHEIRTVFQSLALHDTLTFATTDGPFSLRCSDPDCPSDSRNLVWQAAERLWASAKRRGSMAGVAVRIDKQIPSQAGLGGGSSDAAAALRALSYLWDLRRPPEALHAIAASLGADVPFFLAGGTALGVNRGETLFRLSDIAPGWVVIAMPAFGVSTADAYRWFDEQDPSAKRKSGRLPAGWALPPAELGNDLEPPVVTRHPSVGRLVRRFERQGAEYAAMSGSGSTVFGIFKARTAAETAAASMSGRSVRTLVTRMLSEEQARHASRLHT